MTQQQAHSLMTAPQGKGQASALYNPALATAAGFCADRISRRNRRISRNRRAQRLQ